MLDLLLHKLSPRTERHHAYLADELGGYLDQGRSKWRVSAGRDSLEERVAEEVAERAAKLTTSGTRSAEHLRDAWHSLYERNPNLGHAHDEAVKAVEVAAIRVVCPNDATATLGKVVGEMKAKPAKWKVALYPSGNPVDPVDPVEVVVGMLKLLWQSQLRHGTPDPAAPISVSREEAEAAVHLALTLVHWFESSAVRA